MAEIVNKRQPTPVVSSPGSTEQKDLVDKRRHHLYNHVEIDTLYQYNPVITELNRVSRSFFAQYITNGVKYWTDRLQNLGFVGTNYGLVKGDPNEIYFIPIKKRENLDPEDTFDKIGFSIMEIVDPYDVHSEVKEFQEQLDRLRTFIDLGLYPLVAEPMTEKQMFYGFEKYDNVTEGRPIIGTIVDINSFAEVDRNHLVATIMWNPEFLNRYHLELVLSKAGTLKMVDLVMTPDVWKDREVVSVTNVGIPVYQYSPMRQTVEEIITVDGFQDYINEAVATGNITLDFVSSLLKSTVETLGQIAQNQKEVPHEETEPAKQDIPTEDASEKDLFGHRLRLYDEDFGDMGISDDPSDFYYN